MTHKHRSIEVGALARVEGEGALDVRVVDGRVVRADLRIYEPPRFFEGFLRGRAITEAPDITARICGICPVAYQMSACQAAEALSGVEVGGALRDLRHLLYCGEWIESHALHIYLLHAPDFLGVESAIELAATDRATVERGLQLKKAGNHIMELVGGRAIHPVNVRVGGFHRAPTPAELAPLREELRWARDAAVDTVRWVAGFDVPDLETDAVFVALTHPDEYAVLSGRIATTLGDEVAVGGFDGLVVEEQVAYSTALHARLRGADRRDRYLVGCLARYALNADRLSPLAREIAAEVGLEHPVRNPFRSIVVRAVEVVHACDTALALLERYEPVPVPAVDVPRRAGVGCGATEAPRGLLWHRYTTDVDGIITDARIVPPTSQNQHEIEHELAAVVEAGLALDRPALTHRCEHAIRNHDPCISCATHFLDLRVGTDPEPCTTPVEAPEGSQAPAAPVWAHESGTSARGAVVIGVGNPYRRDDGVGPVVAARVGATLNPEQHPGVRVCEHDGEPAGLLDLWDGAEIAVVVDSVRTGAPAGTVHRIALGGTAPPTSAGSTHGLGLGAAVELACALDRLPPTLVVYGIEAGDAGDGPGLCGAVAEAADQVAAEIGRVLDEEVRPCV
jgi:hydrogenase maturation protease